MTEPTADKWAALREPFPPEAIEYLPRAGRKLAYVSHGHVNDRLLQVDPEFTYEPLLDENGRPIVVLDGLSPGDKVGIWAELYILGTSVVEFCSGTNLMDAYSRCLCRCAMRRGVALDLWIGDDVPKDDVRKEGGLGEVKVPKTWAEVRAWYDEYGSWELAELFTKAFMYHQWGTVDTADLNKEQRQLVLQKAAGATVWLAENDNTPLGPTPTVEHYQKAWAHVTGGIVLEVPEWRPPKEEQPADEEAEAIADEVFEAPGSA